MQKNLHKDIQSQLSCFGYSVVDDYFDSVDLDALLLDFESSKKNNEFHPAKISEGERNQKIRGDWIHWWDEIQMTPIQRTIQAKLDQFLHDLNKKFFFNIDHINLHYAFYPEGSFYKIHLDQPQGKSERVVTFILYLNSNWTAGDGGELKLYLDDNFKEFEIIEPLFGRVIFFLSHQFYHEVLIAQKPRLSLTGWFRRRASNIFPV